MAHYFGFTPSQKLSDMIDEAEHIIYTKADVDYYPYRNALVQQIARELNDNFLVRLVQTTPNPERKAAMDKIATTIERSTESMLKVLLGKDSNEDILPSFYFLENETMFIDNEGKRRVGFQLTDAQVQTIYKGFDAVSDDHVDLADFRQALITMSDAAMYHFMTRFTQTLKLGMIKRRAIPVTKAAIDKGVGIALNRLLPQLPNDGVNRLAQFYRPYFIEIPDNAE